MKGRIFAFLIGLLTVLIVLEISLRIIGFSYQYSRGTSGDLTARKDGSFVILCLGNSFTLGTGAPPEESYPKHLQRMFDERVGGKKVVVINRGRGSENTAELLDRLEFNINDTKPDLIILQTGQPNSWNFTKYGNYASRTSAQDGSLIPFTIINDLLNKSSVYRLFSLLKASIGPSEKPERWIENQIGHSYAYRKDNEYIEFANQVMAGNRDFFADENKVNRAINVFKEGIKIEPNCPLNYVYLAKIYLYQGNQAEASKWFEKVSEVDPSYFYRQKNEYKDFVRLVQDKDVAFFADESQVNRAINVFKKGVEIDPDYPENYRYISEIYLHQNNYDETLAWFMKEAAVSRTLNKEENEGFFYIKRMRKNLNGPQGERVKEKIDRFVDEYEKTNTRGIFSIGKEEINRWRASDIAEMVKVIRSRNIKLIIQNYPYRISTDGLGIGGESNEILRNVATQLQVPFVDNVEIFKAMAAAKGVKDNEEYFVQNDFGHCNGLGYKVMAENVYNKIIEEKLLDTR